MARLLGVKGKMTPSSLRQACALVFADLDPTVTDKVHTVPTTSPSTLSSWSQARKTEPVTMPTGTTRLARGLFWGQERHPDHVP